MIEGTPFVDGFINGAWIGLLIFGTGYVVRAATFWARGGWGGDV